MAFIIGLAVGIIVGALGAGGGILAVPILVYLLHQDPQDAAAASLMIVGVTALVALPGRWRAGDVRVKDGLIFGALSAIGSLLGGLLSRFVSSDVLMSLFAVLLVAVGLVMLRRARLTRKEERLIAAGREDEIVRKATWAAAARDSHGLLLLIVSATLTGFLTGFFGVGGGFAVVPMLVLVMAFGMKQASGTSLLVMVIASVAGLASRLGADIHIDWPVIALFAVGSSLGGVLGGPLTKRVPSSVLTLVFALLLLGVAVATGIQAIPALYADLT